MICCENEKVSAGNTKTEVFSSSTTATDRQKGTSFGNTGVIDSQGRKVFSDDVAVSDKKKSIIPYG